MLRKSVPDLVPGGFVAHEHVTKNGQGYVLVQGACGYGQGVVAGLSVDQQVGSAVRAEFPISARG